MIFSLRNLKSQINRLYQNGFLYVIGSNTLSKVFTFIGNIFVVHFLTKETYGIYTYVNNLMGIFIIADGFGVKSGILQFCSETRTEDEKKSYYNFGLKFGFLFNVLIFTIYLLFSIFAPLKIEGARPYLLIYSIYPLTYFFIQYFLSILISKRQNKYYAYVATLNSLLYAVGEIILTYYIGVAGIIYGIYLGCIAGGLLALHLIRPETFKKAKSLDMVAKKTFLRFSGYSCLNTTLSNLLILIDVFIIGQINSNAEDLASYKVGITIPEAMIFLPSAVIMFAYSYFAEHNKDKKWFSENSKKLYLYSALLNGVISIILFSCSAPIIKLLYGEKYLSSVRVFRIMTVYYFVASTFRMNSSNLLASLRRVDITLIVNIATGVLNIVLDILLVYRLGAQGAAWGTLIVSCLASVALIFSLRKLMKKINGLDTY